LLLRIAGKDVLVDEAGEGAERGVPTRPEFQDRNARLHSVGIDEELLQLARLGLREEHLERGQVERDRDELPVDLSHNAVLVGTPFGEAREIVHDRG
jgi:hypothetical protein